MLKIDGRKHGVQIILLLYGSWLKERSQIPMTGFIDGPYFRWFQFYSNGVFRGATLFGCDFFTPPRVLALLLT